MVARRNLSVQVSAAEVERLFSSTGLTATKLRNRLSPDSIAALSLLRNNESYADRLHKTIVKLDSGPLTPEV